MEITYNTENNYVHYPNQCEPQRAFIELRCSEDHIHSSYVSDIGNSTTTMDVWHNRSIRFYISPYLRIKAINDLMDEIAPLAEKVFNGYSEDWDGSNWAGSLTDDAETAKEEIQELLNEECTDTDRLFTTYTWSDYFDWTDIVEETKDFSSVEGMETGLTELIENDGDMIEGESLEDYLFDLFDCTLNAEQIKKYPIWIMDNTRLKEIVEGIISEEGGE